MQLTFGYLWSSAGSLFFLVSKFAIFQVVNIVFNFHVNIICCCVHCCFCCCFCGCRNQQSFLQMQSVPSNKSLA